MLGKGRLGATHYVCVADTNKLFKHTGNQICYHLHRLICSFLCLKLFKGDTVVIERVSPAVIILRPPEKLVIEVRTSGEYQVPFWYKNENEFGTSGFQVMVPEEFPNFFEIFVRDNTTDDDLGIYRVLFTVTSANSQTHTILPSPDGVDFAVIAPG